MTRNRCYTYFKITGDFDPDEVTALLGLQPDESWKRGELKRKGHASMRREGLTYTFSAWVFGRCEEYDPYVEAQMRRTITPLLDRIDLLNRIRTENDVEFWLVIVPEIYAGDINPYLAPPLDVIDFCHATRTEIDIDMYIYDSTDEWACAPSALRRGRFCVALRVCLCYNVTEPTPGGMTMNDQHWTSIWGNAVSIAENRPERYAKNITIRYPIRVPFGGAALRLTFDNYCGTEPVTINKTTLLVRGKTPPDSCGVTPLGEGGCGRFLPVTFGEERSVTIGAGENVTSDPVAVDLHAGETVYVSFYLADFTLMRSVVFTCGPLSGGLYANGDETETVDIDVNTSRATKLNYFLSNVSILTAPENRTIVCYGDSITAQDWPDDLQIRCAREGCGHTAIIRRAASGTRILREYTCLTYESYGLMGSHRFEHEVPTDGADAVIIQQGINDIIHPVGEEVNIFRPMSDLPTVEELIEGLKTYIAQARAMGLKVYVGTLIPMGGWRTDAPFRQEMRHAYNDFIRTTDLIDGCIDFDKALRDPDRPDWFLPAYDSGDHLHPSKKGYERMAAEVPEEMLK